MDKILILATLLTPGLFACGPNAPAAPRTEPTAPVARPAQATPGDWIPYSDPALHLAFDHPSGRRVGPCPEGEGPDCVALYEGQTHLVSLRPFDGAVETIAEQEAGFVRNDAGVLMTSYGRFEPVQVETFPAAMGRGLKAVITCGVSDDETGFHAAGGACLWAVVGDASRAVVASTNGSDGLDEDTLKTIQSIRRIGD